MRMEPNVADRLGQMAPFAEREQPATCVQTRPPSGPARFLLLADPSLAGAITPSAWLERHAINAATRPSMKWARNVEDLLGETAPFVEWELPVTCVQTRPLTGQARLSLPADPNLAGEVALSAEVERHATHAAMVPIVLGGNLEFANATNFKS